MRLIHNQQRSESCIIYSSTSAGEEAWGATPAGLVRSADLPDGPPCRQTSGEVVGGGRMLVGCRRGFEGGWPWRRGRWSLCSPSVSVTDEPGGDWIIHFTSLIISIRFGIWDNVQSQQTVQSGHNTWSNISLNFIHLNTHISQYTGLKSNPPIPSHCGKTTRF